MQGLADGYFVIPYTIGNYFATDKIDKTVTTSHPEFKKAEQEAEDKIKKYLSINGKRTPTSFHKELGKVVWNNVGMGRNEKGLKEALEKIPQIREEFWQNLNVTGEAGSLNLAIEKANRVADFLEFAELLAYDALERDESCGGHFREEHQTPDGEAVRNDEKFAHVAAWEYKGYGQKPIRHVEELVYENLELSVRSYK